MDLESQMHPTGVDLSQATLEDLVREIKTRFTAVALVGLCDDDDGDERLVTWRQGGRVSIIGMLADYQHSLLTENQAGE